MERRQGRGARLGVGGGGWGANCLSSLFAMSRMAVPCLRIYMYRCAVWKRGPGRVPVRAEWRVFTSCCACSMREGGRPSN